MEASGNTLTEPPGTAGVLRLRGDTDASEEAPEVVPLGPLRVVTDVAGQSGRAEVLDGQVGHGLVEEGDGLSDGVGFAIGIGGAVVRSGPVCQGAEVGLQAVEIAAGPLRFEGLLISTENESDPHRLTPAAGVEGVLDRFANQALRKVGRRGEEFALERVLVDL